MSELKRVKSEEELRSLLRPEVILLFRDQFKDIPSHTLDVQINECLKYLYLASLYKEFSGSFIPVTKEIDEIWHYLIIQTQDYANFCMKLPTGTFIHHQSIHFTEFSQPLSREQIMTSFLKWIARYVQTFGPFPEAALEYWVVIKFLRSACSFSIDTIYSIVYDMLGVKPASDHSSPQLTH